MRCLHAGLIKRLLRQVHRLGATWELLLDPATLLFFVGGLTMLAVQGGACHQDDQPYTWRNWIADVRRLTFVIVAWLPVRAGLLMALYLHRVLRSDPDRPLHAMNHFFSPWMLLLLLIVPVLPSS